MKYMLDISDDTILGEAARSAMQVYAYRIKDSHPEKFFEILENIHLERRRILGEFSGNVKK